MKCTLALLAVAALALPATALAKGPAGATIGGPGIGSDINVPGSGENVGTPLGDLTHYAGFFPAVFGQTPDPMRKDRPKGDLGPKYTITYRLPDQDGQIATVEQDLYPYANPPFTYTKPGQEIFDGLETRGGWYTKGIPALRVRLIEAGLLPTRPPGGTSSDEGAAVSTSTVVALVSAVALLLLATAVLLRRRPQRAVSPLTERS
jgi:hypothetical protein